MNAEISNSYRVGQQIEHTETDLHEAQRAVSYTRLGLKLMFVTTLLQYFIFCMGFYVADVFGLTTWLTRHTAEWSAFALFLVMAVLGV
jgi:hypothetical protein